MNDIVNTNMIGHNKPPETLAEQFQSRHKALLDRYAELLDSARQAPAEIKNDIDHNKVLELIAAMRAVEKQLDAIREIEREPYSDKVKEVNGWFKSRIEPMTKTRETLNGLHTAYSQAKAAAERRKLEEEADRRRQEEAAALAAAAEAERKKREAEVAQAKAEAERRAAEEARARAIKDREESEARAQAAKETEARLAAERKERERVAAEAAKVKAEQDEADRIASEERRRIDDEAAAKARAERQEAEAATRAAKEAAATAQAQQRLAEEAEAQARRDGRAAGRDERQHLATAVREDRRADRLERTAEGPESNLARARSEFGAVGTLTRRWTARVVDRNLLTKEELWPFINGEALDSALFKWMMAQAPEHRTMSGAEMHEETIGQVR